MSWENFYLATFLVGFLLSALSVLGGALHVPHWMAESQPFPFHPHV